MEVMFVGFGGQGIPLNDLALVAGYVRKANVAALGALVSRTGLVDMRILRSSVELNFEKNRR
jgi:Pyruvate/2-oxoacid:ferredoxin oxidoreductase gamma subunit